MHGSIIPISKVIHHGAAFVHAASPACGGAASRRHDAAKICMPRLHEPECIAASHLLPEQEPSVCRGRCCFREHLMLTCVEVPGPWGRPTGQSSRRCRDTAALRWHQMQWTMTGSLASGTAQAHERCALSVWGWQS